LRADLAGQGSHIVPANQDKGIPLAEAAKQLDISQELLRKRIYRRLITGYKVGGRWYVVLNPDAQDNQEEPAQNQDTQDNQLYDTMASDIAFLRSELAARTEELRRKDHLIAALTEIISSQHRSLPVPHPQDEPLIQHYFVEQDRSGHQDTFWTRMKRFVTG
jgi:hypothetical protein